MPGEAAAARWQRLAPSWCQQASSYAARFRGSLWQRGEDTCAWRSSLFGGMESSWTLLGHWLLWIIGVLPATGWDTRVPHFSPRTYSKNAHAFEVASGSEEKHHNMHMTSLQWHGVQMDATWPMSVIISTHAFSRLPLAARRREILSMHMASLQRHGVQIDVTTS